MKPSQFDFRQGNAPRQSEEVKIVEPQSIQFKPDSRLTDVELKKLTAFHEILNSKKDNDPRIDSELKELSPQFKATLSEIYAQLPVESRNGRGLITFLVARDLESVQDARFLQQVFQEAPCLSLQNCTSLAPSDPHMDGINQTSLSYPQLAALFQLERRLESNQDLLQNPEIKAEVSNILREARQFPVGAVQDRAESIQIKLGL